MAFDGRGGEFFSGAEAKAVAAELLERAASSASTAATYREIGYAGHAACARLQAERLTRAAGKVLRGESVYGYETREYDG